MPTTIEVEKMLGRKKPVSQEEWIQILECVTNMIRPILKNTTLPRLCDIRLGLPTYLAEREEFFSDKDEARMIIQTDQACERMAGTEGIFFLTNSSESGSLRHKSPVLGLTRNGKWVLGSAEWKRIQSLDPQLRSSFGRPVTLFWVAESEPARFGKRTDIQIPEVVDVLFTVLNGIIMRKNMQLTDLKSVSGQIGNIIQTARSIPRELPRT